MKVRSILFPMTRNQDVLVMQSLNQESNEWETIPLVSSNSLSKHELDEIVATLTSNEQTANEYMMIKEKSLKALTDDPSVLNAESSDVVSSETSEVSNETNEASSEPNAE